METEKENFKIQINYDEESKKEGLLKIIPNDGVTEIILSADDLLEIIGKNIQGKGIAISLREVDRNEIWMMKVMRTFSFAADKDYLKGDTITGGIEHPYPVLLYAAEREFETCKEGTDKTFYAISTEGLTTQMVELAQNNVPFLNHFTKLLKNTSSTHQEVQEVTEPEETTM